MITFDKIHEYCKSYINDNDKEHKAVALCNSEVLESIVESAGDKAINTTPSKIGPIEMHFKSCTIVSDNFKYTFIAPEDYTNTDKMEIIFDSEGKTTIYDCNC